MLNFHYIYIIYYKDCVIFFISYGQINTADYYLVQKLIIRQHELQSMLTDDRVVCLTRGNSAAHAVCAVVIWCSLCQITLASC